MVKEVWEKGTDVRAGDEVLLALADLEDRKYQNRYCVARDKEPIISCFRNTVPLLLVFLLLRH